MKKATDRSVLRWIHIVFGLTILGYIYGPQEEVLPYRDYFRFIFVPAILLTGFWMWIGPAVRRLVSKSSAQQDATDNL